MKKISKNILLLGSLFLISGCQEGSTSTKYTVNFYVGNQIVSTQKVDANSTIAKPVIEGTNYVWQVGDMEDRYWNFDGYFADRVNGNINLYATTLYKITLNANGGACEAKSLQVEEGESYILPSPQKEASTFLGWFDGDGRLFENTGVWNLNSDLTLTAKYVTSNRVFTLNVGSGTCGKTSVTFKYGSEFELPIPTTTATDGGWALTFDYWKINNKKVDNQGNSWDYIDEATEFVAVYKLNETDEYLESKYNFEYSDINETYKIISEKENLAHAFIPNTYNNKPVAEIGDNVFKDNSSLSKVTFTNNIKRIGKYAFSNCSNLNVINLPESVETLGEGIFSENANLYVVSLNDKIISIPNKAFCNCTSINLIENIDMVESIGNSAFENCSVLHNVEFGDHLKSIGNAAFKGCTLLSDMDNIVFTIPDSCETIGEEAFFNCKFMRHIKLPASLKEIKKQTFSNAKRLYEIVIPEGVTYIGVQAFEGCNDLTSVVIPSTCKIIDTRAFFDTVALTSIQFSEGVEIIKSQAFSPVMNVESVSLPNSLNVIENANFVSDYAPNLRHYERDNCSYLGNEENNYLYLTKVNDTTITEFETHSGTKIISGSAFKNCNNLKKLILGLDVTYVCHNAFDSNTSLEEVRVLGATKFGNNVFRHCSNLRTVELANGIEEISTNMFYECSLLKNINLPNTLKRIDNAAFYNCKQIESLTLPSSLEEVGIEAFISCEGLTKVKVLGSTNFGESAFRGCEKLKEVTFASGTESISNTMFTSCTSLEKIELPNTLKKIGESAFVNCGNLKFINFPSSLEEICDLAFVNSGIKFAYIPKNIVKIGDCPFLECEINTFYCEVAENQAEWNSRWHVNENGSEFVWNYEYTIFDDIIYQVNDVDVTVVGYLPNDNKNLVLRSYIYDKPVTKIKDEAFMGRDDIKTCIISRNMLEIGMSAFMNCSAMHSVIIPTGVTTIAKQAFYGTAALRNIQIPKSVAVLGDQAFSFGPSKVFLEEAEQQPGWNLYGSGVSVNMYDFGAPRQYEFNNLRYYFKNEGDTYFSVETLDDTNIDTFEILEEVDGTSVKELVKVSSTELTEVIIPSFIEKIDEECFTECSNLLKVIFKAGVREVGEKAFKGLSDLAKVYIPRSITIIASNAFKECGKVILYIEASFKPSTWPESFIDVDEPHTRWNCILSDLNN